MEPKRCLNCGGRVPLVLRGDAKFCGRNCKNAYEKRARQIGLNILGRVERHHANSNILRQAKPAALVTVKSLETPPTYFSGHLEYFAPAEFEITLRTTTGRPLVADLREVEIILRQSERVDALAGV